MSFQLNYERLLLAPKALAIRPAPPVPKNKKLIDKDKNSDAKAPDEKKQDQPPDAPKSAAEKAPEADGKAEAADNKAQDQGGPGPKPEVAIVPPTPGSNVAEPPTPATGLPAESPTAAAVAHGNDGNDDKIDKDDNEGKGEQGDKTDKAKAAGADDADTKTPAPVKPLDLAGPKPLKPLVAEMEADLAACQYPAILCDPRGAYHKYARMMTGDSPRIRIDMVRDGWLHEPWRERTMRDALERLDGRATTRLAKSLEKAAERRGTRKVPHSAEELLKELWNDCLDMPHREIASGDFWDQYDWSAADAQVHLREVRTVKPETSESAGSGATTDDRPEKGDVDVAATEAEGGILSDAGEQSTGTTEEATKSDAGTDSGPRWTREGVELALAAVGVQMLLKTEKPLRGYSPTSSMLLMAHGHFFVRDTSYVKWVREASAGDFEAIKPGVDDRVFGQMVKKQLEAERRERRAKREKEKKAKDKEEKDRKKKEDQDRGAEVGAADEKKPEKAGDAKKDEGDNGEEVKAAPEAAVPAAEKKDGGGKHDGEQEIPAADEAQAESAKVVKAAEDEANEDDQKPAPKHKEVPKADAAPAKEGDKDEAKKQARRPSKDAVEAEEAMFAQMLKASGLPADAAGLDDLRAAIQVLEAAAAQGGPEALAQMGPEAAALMQLMKGGEGAGHGAHLGAKDKDGKDVPYIWTWGGGSVGSCERWRWKNFHAGLHDVGADGWEARDWRVFADGREVRDFDADMRWEEVGEVDVHDWSC